MTGLQAGEADCQDVLLTGGDQRYCQFRYSRFQPLSLDQVTSPSLIAGRTQSLPTFRRCNLQNAEMSKARLLNADLRGSRVENLHLNAEDIRGAVVDPSQAMIFASLLGIRIE